MTLRRTLLLGGLAGLLPPLVVLTLLWRFGVFIILMGGIDLRAILWPSSVMLTLGWCCTVAGILITISSVAINCLMYIAIALLLHASFRWLRQHMAPKNL